MFSVADIVILALIAVAFVAVVIRTRRKGTCGDCAQAGSCGHARTGSCPAAKGVDQVAQELSQGVK